MRILIAEDEVVSRIKLQARLQKWGYEVTVARDGDEAWAMLQDPDAPSLAIIDWMMPGMDGPELCRRIRTQGREPYVYVILLTGKDGKADLIEGLQAGADDYVTKPVDAQELEVRVRGGQRIVDLHSELLASRQALWFQATHDTLTGACNRAAALVTLQREMARTDREKTPFSVALIDLDHFKKVNDTFGHLGGDAVLKETVKRMGLALRPYDTVSRHGGEEFLLVLPGCDLAAGATVAERVRKLIAERPVDVPGHAIDVTCSIGVSACDAKMDIDTLIRQADDALYLAKRSGRNQVMLGGTPLKASA